MTTPNFRLRQGSGGRAEAPSARRRAQPATSKRTEFIMRFATPLLVTLLAANLWAQSAPRFEVASVRVNTSNPPMQVLPTLQPGGRVFAVNLPLRELIQAAYGLRDNQLIFSSQIADARFDIEARAGATATRDHAVVMLRTLLAERFNLKTHAETRELPVYSLVRVSTMRMCDGMSSLPSESWVK